MKSCLIGALMLAVAFAGGAPDDFAPFGVHVYSWTEGAAEAAPWIGDGEPERSGADCYAEDPAPEFCAEFSLPEGVTETKIRFACAGFGWFDVNGAACLNADGLDPLWSVYDRTVYSTTVTAKIKPGANRVRVFLGNGFYNLPPLLFWGTKCFREAVAHGRPCFRLSVDGVGKPLVWKWRRTNVVRNSVYLGTEIDATRPAETDWRPAAAVKGPKGEIVEWPRTNPQMGVRDVRRGTVAWLKEREVQVVDFGTNASGVPSFTFQGEARGTRIEIVYGERLNPDGSVNVLTQTAGQIKPGRSGGPGAPSLACQRDAYVCGGGRETFRPPFTWHVCRYAEIRGARNPVEEPTRFVRSMVSADLRAAAPAAKAFETDDADLKAIHAVCRRTFQANLIGGVQSDCPGRERLGYGGDIVSTCEAMCLNFDMREIYLKILRDFADEAADDGWITETAPYVGIGSRGFGGRSGPIGWSLAVPVLMDAVMRHYPEAKDRALAFYPVCARYVRLVDGKCPSGIVPACIGDHEALERVPDDCIATAHWHEFVRLTAWFAEMLGRTDDAAAFESLRGKIRDAFARRFVRDGTVANGVQGAQAVGLHLGLVPDDQVKKAEARLLAALAAKDYAPTTGIFATRYMLMYLAAHGRNDVARRVVLHRGFPGWLHMLDRGATTLWETWKESDDVFSNCHPMFGSVDEWILRYGSDAAARTVRAGTDRRPAALLGSAENVQGLRCDVLTGGRIRSVLVPPAEGLAPADYGRFAAVYLGGTLKGYPVESLWSTPERQAAVSNYVARGGAVIVSGGAVRELGAPGLVGFARTRPATESLVRRSGGTSALLWNYDKWNSRDTLAADGLLPGTETLAVFVDGKGRDAGVAATRRPLGKGAVWWISPQVSTLRLRLTWGGFNLGNADEKGRVQSTPEGEALAALAATYLAAFKSAASLDDELPPSDWGLKPLGKAGSLKFDASFAHVPRLGKPPVRQPAFTFWEKGGPAKGVVAVPRGEAALMELAGELAWHLGEMCGDTIAVVSEEPAEGPAVVFGKVDERAHPKGTAVLRTSGNRLYVGGTGFWGAGIASTYLMEALGIRYLWPGKSGKVIPRRDEIVLPKIDLVHTPAFRHREIRMYDIGAKSRSEALEWLGIDTAKFARALAEAECDRPGNRSFSRWHGFARGRPEVVPDDFEGEWRWGHAFDGWYQRHFRNHPDWFALQPTGVREQDLGYWPERCTLCLSSEGLAAAAADDLIARFKSSPRFEALSICLPDGGFPAPCMCAGCRALDPVNAPSSPVYFWKVFNRSFPYVSFTDRVMAFNNRIAARVAEACPGKMLTCYVYSNYVDPPVAVKPHPSLVLLSVAGEYADSGQREWARKNLAAWSRTGNPILWRPNAPMGFKSPVPQNFARHIFSDLETFKANNVIGTDMDCVSRQWTNLGLVFYMMAKAQVNPDALDYETLLADYCRAGFGAAADEVRAYFAAVEKLTDDAAATHRRIRGYVGVFDGDALDAILDRAVARAKGDAAVLARIAFLRRGVACGRWEQRLAAAEKAAPDARKALKDEYFEFVRKTSFEDPVALCPVYIGQSFYRSPFLR